MCTIASTLLVAYLAARFAKSAIGLLGILLGLLFMSGLASGLTG